MNNQERIALRDDRQAILMELLKTKPLKSGELQKITGVSKKTLYADMQHLEKKGIVEISKVLSGGYWVVLYTRLKKPKEPIKVEFSNDLMRFGGMRIDYFQPDGTEHASQHSSHALSPKFGGTYGVSSVYSGGL